MQGCPWNEFPGSCGGPALTEEGAADIRVRCVSLWTFRVSDCPAPGLCSAVVPSGVLSPTSTGTAEHGSLGLLIRVSDKLIYPHWTLVLHRWLKTGGHFIWEGSVCATAWIELVWTDPGHPLWELKVKTSLGSLPSERPKGPYKPRWIQAKAIMTSL